VAITDGNPQPHHAPPTPTRHHSGIKPAPSPLILPKPGPPLHTGAHHAKSYATASRRRSTQPLAPAPAG
jgi:hypothetical protein